MQIVVTETNMNELKTLQEEDSIKDIELAKLFHDTYERLAPEYGYKTREDTKEFDPFSPNGRLMIEVCRIVGNKSYTLGMMKGVELVEGEIPKYPPNSDREELVLEQIKSIIKKLKQELK